MKLDLGDLALSWSFGCDKLGVLACKTRGFALCGGVLGGRNKILRVKSIETCQFLLY